MLQSKQISTISLSDQLQDWQQAILSPSFKSPVLFAHLLSAYFNLFRKNYSQNADDQQQLVQNLGYEMGTRIWEFVMMQMRLQEKQWVTKNDCMGKANKVAQIIKNNVWPFLFNKQLDSLEKVNSTQEEYYFIENICPLSQFISYSKNETYSLADQIVSGMLKACFDASGIETEIHCELVGAAQQSYWDVKIK